MKLATIIRLYVAVNAVSQKDLAKEWGVGESTVTRFLKNGQMPDGRSTARIIAWLFDDGRSAPNGKPST